MEDNANTISFVRLEKWSLDNRRVSTTVAVSQTDNNTFITIRTHGCETEVPNVVLGSMPLAKQIGAVFHHIDNSSFCGGFCLSEGESLLALADCVKGSYRDLSAESVEQQQVVYFSSSCKIFSSRDGRCSKCKNLLRSHNLKRQRKEKRTSIHPHCNRRYLTRGELNVLLQNERTARLNAERRERYWRGKFDSEAVELEDDDHEDLSQMLTNVPKEKVPEEMLCMWEQQKKMLTTKSKHGYRWHPK